MKKQRKTQILKVLIAGVFCCAVGTSGAVVNTFAEENIPSVTLMGDMNADNNFSVVDVVLLQKWLLNIPDTHIDNWKNGDFMEDNTLNIFDLALMKRALTEKLNEPEVPAHLTGWVTDGVNIYFLDENGERCTGWLTDNGATYYLDKETGARLTGWLELESDTVWTPDFDNQENWTDEDWDKFYDWYWGDLQVEKNYYYFSPDDGSMQTGWLTLSEGTYYLDEDGKRHFGFLEYDGKIYGFGEDGLMITNKQVSNGKYDENGVFTKSKYNISVEMRNLLDNAPLGEQKRSITVYDRQYPEKGTPVEFTFKLSDKDYQIIEKFAAEHFSPDMTLSERLYETWMWIHENVDYAYAGEKWDEIVGLSYPDAIFNHKLGQCVQYNGAMASVLAYYGFDVYMVKGWTNPPKNTTQHYWTEVNIDGNRYYVETGNLGKNGSYWKYFFVDAENVSYTKTGAFETSE